jgi:hypothetical protein
MMRFSIRLALLSFFSLLSFITFGQSIADSTMVKDAITPEICVQSGKKYLGKDVTLACTVVGSREITLEKAANYILLEANERFPLNKVSILISEGVADETNFSRFKLHSKKVLIKGKVEKVKSFKDDFGNPRLVIYLKDPKQIFVF